MRDRISLFLRCGDHASISRRLCGAVSTGVIVVAVVALGGQGRGYAAPARPPARTVRGIAPPRFFVNLVQFSGFVPNGDGFSILAVRDSADGRLVAADLQTAGADGLAAYGNGRDLVVAMPTSLGCATQLYRLRLSRQGQPGVLAPLGHQLPGWLYSVAASADGQVIGYAISGCVKGQPGYLGIMHARTGLTRQWGSVNIGGVSPGPVALNSGLSMSADGGLLAFTGSNLTAGGRVTSQTVRVLRSDAPAGTVARRSRVVVRGRVFGPDLAGVSLSREGASFYLCAVNASRYHRVVTVLAYRTATGQRRETVARLAAAGPAYPQFQLGCPMALDTSGSFLLVPYQIRYPKDPSDHPVLSMARIRLATRSAARLSFTLPITGGIDEAVSVRLGW
jgi:hypothetical protein